MKAVRVRAVEDLRGRERTSGAYDVRIEAGEVHGLAFICPCGCRRQGYLPARGYGHSHEWDITGNLDCLTVSPGIQFADGCCWRGWLNSGEWVSASSPSAARSQP